jgi:predicted metalloprotease with PDZ domain
VNAGDEIVAVGGFRVTPDQYVARLEALPPGKPVPLLVARRDALKTLTITIADVPPPMWELHASTNATPTQQQHLAAWLR